MQKSIKKNYVYNLLYQAVTMLAPLMTTPYISRVLKADGIGEYSYANSIVSYFALFAVMGVSTYGQREISYYQNDLGKRSEVFWNAKALECITSLIAFIMFAVLAKSQKNPALYFALSINILACTIDITWLFQGKEEFGIVAIRNIIIKVLGIIGIFLFVKNKSDVAIYALVISGLGFISNATLWIPAKKIIRRPDLHTLNPFKNFRIVLSLFIPCIAMEVYSVLDKTMIGLICKDSFQNGYYEQASKISRMVLVLVTSLGTVMIPRIGFHFERGEKEIIANYMERAYRFVWFLATPLCFGLIAVSKNFVPWFFGNGYDEVVPLIYILAFLILPIGINNVTGMQYLIPTKRQNLFTKSVVAGAIVNFFLNLILIQLWGARGAAVASVFAEMVVALSQILMVRREISLVKVIKYGRNNRIAALIMLTGLFMMEKYLKSSVANTILIIFCGCICYFGVLLIIKDKFFCGLLKRQSGMDAFSKIS